VLPLLSSSVLMSWIRSSVETVAERAAIFRRLLDAKARWKEFPLLCFLLLGEQMYYNGESVCSTCWASIRD
jgi:hypothetical protein